MPALSVVGANSWAQRRLRVRKTNFSAPVNITTDGAEMTLSAGSSLKCEDTELSCGVPKVEPLRILIIEDSITVIMIVTKLLEKKGHIVESAKNGFSGLNRLKEVFNTRSDFDLVLLDVQMPVLDGFECVSRYRAFEVEQIKNLNNSVLSKSKTDTLKLLLHSNYFRVNYTNNLGSNSFNIDNFKYMKSDGSSKNSVGSQEPAHVCHSIKLANVPDDYYDARPDARIGSPEHNSMNIGRDFGPRLHGSSPKEGISRTSSSNGLNVVLRRGNMAIVGMSANNDNESRILALRKGMNFFITKPFSGVDLQNILNLFDS